MDHHEAKTLAFDDSDEDAILDITQILKAKDREIIEHVDDITVSGEFLLGSTEEEEKETKGNSLEEIGFVQLHDAHKDVLVGTAHLDTWPSLSLNLFTGWGGIENISCYFSFCFLSLTGFCLTDGILVFFNHVEFLWLGIPAAVSLFLEWGMSVFKFRVNEI